MSQQAHSSTSGFFEIALVATTGEAPDVYRSACRNWLGRYTHRYTIIAMASDAEYALTEQLTEAYQCCQVCCQRRKFLVSGAFSARRGGMWED
jgi:hypothetical protein